MAIFKDILAGNQTLFKNESALDYEFLPKVLPYREKEQRRIAIAIKPLFERRNGKNLFIYGKQGIGKTAATRNLLNELEEETDEIIPIYINCWKHNTDYKIALEICDIVGYKWIQNRNASELLNATKEILNKKSAVIVLDEVDKLQNPDIIYFFIEELFRKTIILITNRKEWIYQLDERIRSRLLPEFLEFKPYNESEIYGILKARVEYAFYDGVIENEIIKKISKYVHKIGDVRLGLFLLRESALIAENASRKKVKPDDVEEAIKKIDEFFINKEEELEEEQTKILQIIKENQGKKIGDLYKIYLDKGGSFSYKTFNRKIKELEKARFVTTERITGKEGNTTLVKLENKKLTDFSDENENLL